MTKKSSAAAPAREKVTPRPKPTKAMVQKITDIGIDYTNDRLKFREIMEKYDINHRTLSEYIKRYDWLPQRTKNKNLKRNLIANGEQGFLTLCHNMGYDPAIMLVERRVEIQARIEYLEETLQYWDNSDENAKELRLLKRDANELDIQMLNYGYARKKSVDGVINVEHKPFDEILQRTNAAPLGQAPIEGEFTRPALETE